MFEILLGVAKLSPVFGVFVVIIYYFYKKERKYISEIKKLNSEIRKSERENLNLMNRLAGALDSLTKGNANIHKEIKGIKKIIVDKLTKITNERDEDK